MYTSQVGNRVTFSGPRAIIPPTVIPFTDHAGRPAHSFWPGEETSQPSFSFQVYITVDLDEPGETLTARFPNELFSDDAGLWRLDVYERQEDVWACLEHQVEERQWRGTQRASHETEAMPGNTKIVESYSDPNDALTVAAQGLIIVIDRKDWRWRDNRDDTKTDGPLTVRFDPRPLGLRSILPGSLEEGASIHEQAELLIQRMHTASNPNRDLQTIWMEATQARLSDQGTLSTQPYFEPTPPAVLDERQLSTYTTPSGNAGVQTRLPPSGKIEDFTLIYTIYAVFPTSILLSPDARLAIARAFLTKLAIPELNGSQQLSARIEIAPPFSTLRECLAHHAAYPPPEVGYISPYPQSPHRRRFPEHLRGASTIYMREVLSAHKSFFIVLDREDWETCDGVSFVWTEPREPDVPYGRKPEEIIIARVGGAMRDVARRLGGLL